MKMENYVRVAVSQMHRDRRDYIHASNFCNISSNFGCSTAALPRSKNNNIQIQSELSGSEESKTVSSYVHIFKQKTQGWCL